MNNPSGVGGDAATIPGADDKACKAVEAGEVGAEGEKAPGIAGEVPTGDRSAVDSVASNVKDDDKKSKDDDTDDDEAEIVEESPCGRWLKRREEIKYRDVPGIDTAYLAMDSEEGVEVVWNEAQFSTGKKFKVQEDKLKNVFEALTLIDHPNIVHFHRYWIDDRSGGERTAEKNMSRLIFITEYMSSGSLKQFLRRTKKNNRKIQLQSWKRWCTQILSALSYLHQTCDPPIVHGNLTCDTIFIQHNGLVKIGSIAPDIIHQNVKTYRSNIKNLHYLAPEWGDSNMSPGTASDVYSFGMCALETAALDIQTTATAIAAEATSELGSKEGSESSATAAAAAATAAEVNVQDAAEKTPGGVITEETIQRTVEQLEDRLQKDFIRRCLRKDPRERPTARELLFHPVLFEVHSLKLLAAHSLVNTPANINETMTDEAIQSHYGPDTVMATIRRNGQVMDYKLSNVPVAEKLEKFMEDVKFGIYPITAFALSQPPPPKTRAVSPESQMAPDHQQDKIKKAGGGSKTSAEDDYEDEVRRVVQALGSIGDTPDDGSFNMIVLVRFDDYRNRQLTCRMDPARDTPEIIVEELIQYKFVSELDRELLKGIVADVFRKFSLKYADKLIKQLDEDVEATELGPEGPVNITRKRTPEEQELIYKQSVFGRLPFFFNEADTDCDARRDPRQGKFMRDPTLICRAFPLPEGAYFCPPVQDEGSEPYQIPPTVTNAFDISHLEAYAAQVDINGSTGVLVGPNGAPVVSTVPLAAPVPTQVPPGAIPPSMATLGPAIQAAPPPIAIPPGLAAPQHTPAEGNSAFNYTPKSYSQDSNASYDPYTYLQEAQKVLESLSALNVQQPQHLEGTSFPPPVTPTGYLPAEVMPPVELEEEFKDV